MTSDEFKLGPALLHTPEADRTLPETFRTQLLRSLDGRSSTAFAVSCKTSLQWVVQERDADVTLTLPVSGGRTDEDQSSGSKKRLGWLPPSSQPGGVPAARLARACQVLSVRGSKPTALTLVQRGTIAKGEAWWKRLFPALQAAHPAGFTSLCLVLQQHLPRQLFTPAAFFRHITRLELGAPGGKDKILQYVQLPPCSTLPELQYLVIYDVAPGTQSRLLESIAPYIEQLVSLTIHQQSSPDTYTDWAMLFVDTSASDTLTHLTLPCVLDLELVHILQECAPVLKELTVNDIDANVFEEDVEDMGMEPVCSWTTLRVSKGQWHATDDWQWLPWPAEGTLTVELPKNAYLDILLPLTETEQDKLSRLVLRGTHSINISAFNLSSPNQPAALRATLPLIASLQWPHTKLFLENFAMSRDLADAIAAVADAAGAGRKLSLVDLRWPQDVRLAAPLPPLQQLGLTRHLKDELLGKVLRCVTSVEELQVPALKLKSPQGLVRRLQPAAARPPQQQQQELASGAVVPAGNQPAASAAAARAAAASSPAGGKQRAATAAQPAAAPAAASGTRHQSAAQPAPPPPPPTALSARAPIFVPRALRADAPVFVPSSIAAGGAISTAASAFSAAVLHAGAGGSGIQGNGADADGCAAGSDTDADVAWAAMSGAREGHSGMRLQSGTGHNSTAAQAGAGTSTSTGTGRVTQHGVSTSGGSSCRPAPRQTGSGPGRARAIAHRPGTVPSPTQIDTTTHAPLDNNSSAGPSATAPACSAPITSSTGANPTTSRVAPDPRAPTIPPTTPAPPVRAPATPPASVPLGLKRIIIEDEDCEFTPEVDLCEFVRQVQLLEGAGFRGIKWKLPSVVVQLSAQQVRCNQHTRLISQLATTRIESIMSISLVRGDDIDPAHQPPAIRHTISLLNALSCKPNKLSLDVWYATDDFVTALTGLKNGGQCLYMDLWSCMDALQKRPAAWPLARLPPAIPRSYTQWFVYAEDLHTNEVEALLLNAPSDRTAKQPLTIHVGGKHFTWVENMNARLRKSGKHPHVRVCE